MEEIEIVVSKVDAARDLGVSTGTLRRRPRRSQWAGLCPDRQVNPLSQAGSRNRGSSVLVYMVLQVRRLEVLDPPPLQPAEDCQK